MKFPLIFVFFLLVPCNVLGKHVNFRGDLTYDDLLQTNVFCAFSESCQAYRYNPFQYRNCGCGSECSEFGTCCIDSPYRKDIVPMVECRNVGLTFSSTGYFLVSRCPPKVDSESVWKVLCETEWNGEDDMMKLAPVSSLETFVHYKNYYCFRCHEDSEQYLTWDLHIMSNFVETDFSVTYDRVKGSWSATAGDNFLLEHVQFFFLPPEELFVQPEMCDFVLISDCDNAWTDEGTREKCKSYTAVVYSTHNNSVSFKNPHCALCNFESVDNIQCEIGVNAAGFDDSYASYFLIRSNNKNDKKGPKKCGENQAWDPYGRKCMRIVCRIPGYVVKNGRCSPP